MNKFPIKPLQDRLIVMQAKTVTNKGSNLIQVTNARPTEGEVIAVGPDVKGLKEGDYVMFANYSGQEVPGATSQANGIPIMLRESEIIALVDVAMVRRWRRRRSSRSWTRLLVLLLPVKSLLPGPTVSRPDSRRPDSRPPVSPPAAPGPTPSRAGGLS